MIVRANFLVYDCVDHTLANFLQIESVDTNDRFMDAPDASDGFFRLKLQSEMTNTACPVLSVLELNELVALYVTAIASSQVFRLLKKIERNKFFPVFVCFISPTQSVGTVESYLVAK